MEFNITSSDSTDTVRISDSLIVEPVKDKIKQLTPVERLWEDLNKLLPLNKSKDILHNAKNYEKKFRLEELIDYQIHLNDLGNISNHEWDYEKEAKSYLFDKI